MTKGAKSEIIYGLPTDEELDGISWADHHGTRRSTRAYQSERPKAVAKLRKAGYPVKSVIGLGRYSTVYGCGDEALKLTGDQTDAAAWARILSLKSQKKISMRDIPALSRVSEAFSVPGGRADLYAIVSPRYRELTEAQKDVVETVVEVLDQGWPCRPGGDADVKRLQKNFAKRLLGAAAVRGRAAEAVRQRVDRRLKELGYSPVPWSKVQKKPELVRSMISLVANLYKDVPRAKQICGDILTTVITLQKHGMWPRDLHVEQFLREGTGAKTSVRLVDLGITAMRRQRQAISRLQ